MPGLKISDIQKQIRLRFGLMTLINTYLRLKITSTQHRFLSLSKFTKPNLIKNMKFYMKIFMG